MDDELNKAIEQEENQMDDTISFGIACFHFGISKEPSFRYTNDQYLAELHKFLETIPNIEQISITDIPDDQIPSQDINEKISDFPEEVFPNWGFGEVKFSIHIPDRIQQQIRQNLQIHTERFEVRIIYFYEMPVTFIIPLDPIGECSNPADAVIVVREFLEQQCLNLNSEYIRFEMLGPSPFHAECYIKPGEDIEFDESSPEFVSKDITIGMGYDKLIFYYDTGIFENRIEAVDHIFHEIISELSYFYQIGRLRLIKIRKWEKIEEMLEDIVLENKKKGIMNDFLKFIYYSGKIKELFIDIAIFEKDMIFANEAMNNDYNDIYSDRWDSHFQNFIDNLMKE